MHYMSLQGKNIISLLILVCQTFTASASEARKTARLRSGARESHRTKAPRGAGRGAPPSARVPSSAHGRAACAARAAVPSAHCRSGTRSARHRRASSSATAAAASAAASAAAASAAAAPAFHQSARAFGGAGTSSERGTAQR